MQVGRKWRRNPLYSCSRSFVVDRSRTVCVGQTVSYHPSAFALVRLEPPILLRQCCDRANIRGTNGDGFWGRTDTRRATAYTSHNRGIAASGGAQRCKGLAVRIAPSGVKTWDLATAFEEPARCGGCRLG